ncbi:MAG: M28 family peptidase [Actinomycetota bacterium]|nr:M28 family peptidase [Actinomycetota bacterium]
MTRRILVPLALLAGFAACSTIPEGQRSTKPASGPPRVREATVQSHARQFDEEEPERLAGSQEELAASAYVVAHLTEAGYVSRLDAVPVADLVRSTNVVALPPGGAESAAIVVVAYDSAPGATPNGLAIGVWLEIARALRAIEPDHSIQFVALGAEHTPVEGGRLGSRRLARQLTDEGASPQMLVVAGVGEGPELSVSGSSAAALEQAAARLGLESAAAPVTGAAEVFAEAGFDTTVIGGAPEGVGAVLLGHLAGL